MLKPKESASAMKQRIAHRTTVFAPRLQSLLDDHVGEDLFRLDETTIGVAGPLLMDQILSARPATEFERPTFKPLLGQSILRADALKCMQAIGRDVRAGLKKPAPVNASLAGSWPHVGHIYLRDLLLGDDPRRLRLLMDRILELTPKLTWAVVTAGAMLPMRLGPQASSIAGTVGLATTYQERRRAMGMYRRTAAPVCFTISTLIANAIWLGAPFDDTVPNRHILYEALRLLPPSWNILRHASPEYAALDERIGPKDDVLILPLVSHRDPALWEASNEFRPERWNELDADRLPGYLPFGHKSERCWGQHMVLPLAEMFLDMLREQRLNVSPRQTTAHVPLAGLLGVAEVHVTAM